jgi:NAD-dependent dihydropyrimidine dehydrogenase PreA subunit
MIAGSVVREILQTVFRMAPWPTANGLRRAGNPGRHSPVLVTCDYDLTVRRLMNALRGVDAWVVVAGSKGINVWCAAAGGHFTSHQVITALKTSGVEQQVDHRRAILPQLAATGVLARDVWRRCHWSVHFGPVYASDIPAYLDNDGKKTDRMRHVVFARQERLEMAAAWGVPTALVVGGIAAAIRLSWALPLVALALVLALVVFLFYERIPGPRRWVFMAAAVLAALAITAVAGAGPAAVASAGAAAALMSAVLTYDYEGSTPVVGSSHFEGQDWRITLDLERCRGVFTCWEVCPEACFERHEDLRKAELANGERCIRCGACIVQCPKDALYFQDAGGRRIEPATIRRFKLNLLGRRVVDAGEVQ